MSNPLMAEPTAAARGRRTTRALHQAARIVSVLLPLALPLAQAAGQVERLNPPDMHSTGGRYSHVVVATGGRTIYVAGQVALDAKGEVVGPGDFRAQARQAMANVEGALRAAGASWGDVVKINTYLADMDSLPILRDVRGEIFRGGAPASTTVEVSRLFQEGLLIEVDAVAVVDEGEDAAH